MTITFLIKPIAEVDLGLVQLSRWSALSSILDVVAVLDLPLP